MTNDQEPERPQSYQPSVGAALSRGWEFMLDTLFRPFDIAKWFILGFSVFLIQCGQGGTRGPANFSSPGGGGGPGGGGPNFSQVADWVGSNFLLIIGIALIAYLVIVGLRLLQLWLSSRGEFMLIDNLANQKAEISRPWRDFAAQGNSLFALRAVISVAIMTVLFAGGVVAVLPVLDLLEQQGGEAVVLIILVSVIPILLVGLGVGLFNFLLGNIVIPVMYARGNMVRAALAESWGLVTANFGVCFLYWLMRVALNIGAGLIIFLGTCVTCCIAGLPYLNAVFFLPISVFFRGFSICFVEEFGPEYQIIRYFDLTTGGPGTPMPSEGLSPYGDGLGGPAGYPPSPDQPPQQNQGGYPPPAPGNWRPPGQGGSQPPPAPPSP